MATGAEEGDADTPPPRAPLPLPLRLPPETPAAAAELPGRALGARGATSARRPEFHAITVEASDVCSPWEVGEGEESGEGDCCRRGGPCFLFGCSTNTCGPLVDACFPLPYPTPASGCRCSDMGGSATLAPRECGSMAPGHSTPFPLPGVVLVSPLRAGEGEREREMARCVCVPLSLALECRSPRLDSGAM